jgi:hypothetical protein
MHVQGCHRTTPILVTSNFENRGWAYYHCSCFNLHNDKRISLAKKQLTQMLDLNKKLQDTRLEQEKTMLSRQVEAMDGAIDKLVYELYELTVEEIGIVEGIKT